MKLANPIASLCSILLIGTAAESAEAAPGDRTPYQTWSVLTCSATRCSKLLPPVPAAHWLEIRSVSCLFAGKNAYTRPTSVRAEISEFTDGNSNTIAVQEIVPERQFEGGYSYVANAETLIVAHAGQRPSIKANYYGQMNRVHCKVAGDLYATN